MINVELLKKVRTIVTHEGCADGIASALILKDALPDANVVFVQYNTPEWRSVDFSADEPGVLYCDMTPAPEQVDEALDSGAIVLDHHRGAQELIAKFGNRGVFADEEAEPGVSGALLAFYEVWARLVSWPCAQAVRLKDFAMLVGIRDTWQRTSPRWEEACALASSLRFWPWEDLTAQFAFQDTFADLMRVGPVLLRKDAELVERAIREAYWFKVGSLRVVAFEGLAQTSDIADRLAGEAELVLGWHYSHGGGLPKVTVSCRSPGPLALSLAQRYGGGGHKRAAGFTVQLPLRESASPYSCLERLVSDFWRAI